jgi:hypothetical protein
VVDRGRYRVRTWRSLIGDAEHAAFMVLTACRMWRFAVENRHSSKTEAAAWALRRNPDLVAVRQAVRRYAGNADRPVDERGIADLLDLVSRELGDDR